MLLKYISSCTEVKGTDLKKRIRNLSRALSVILQNEDLSGLVGKQYSPMPGEKWSSSLPWFPSPQLLLAEVVTPSSSVLYKCFSNLNGLRKVTRKMPSPFFCPLTSEKAASKIETCLANENSKARKRKEKSPHPAYYLCERLVQRSIRVKMVSCFCYLSRLEFGA